MALISCPECGGQISDGARQCVHCGFRFTICPECGKAVGINQKSCSHCGYELQGEIINDFNILENAMGDDSKSALVKDNYITAWEKKSSLARFTKKALKYGNIVLVILSLIFILIAVVMFLIWNSANFEDKLLDVNSKLSTIKTMIIIGGVFLGVRMTYYTLISSIRSLMLSNWLSENKLDPIKGIKRYYEMETDEEFVNGDLLIEAGHMQCVSSAKDKMILILSALLILAECCCICTAVCACQNIEFYMLKTVIWEQSFQFQYLALIFAVVFLISYVIMYFVGFRSFGKKESEWLEKVAPGLNEVIAKKAQEIINNM